MPSTFLLLLNSSFLKSYQSESSESLETDLQLMQQHVEGLSRKVRLLGNIIAETKAWYETLISYVAT